MQARRGRGRTEADAFGAESLPEVDSLRPSLRCGDRRAILIHQTLTQGRQRWALRPYSFALALYFDESTRGVFSPPVRSAPLFELGDGSAQRRMVREARGEDDSRASLAAEQRRSVAGVSLQAGIPEQRAEKKSVE